MKFSVNLLRAAQAIKPHVPSIKFRKAQVEIPSSSKPTISQSTPTASGGNRILIDERHLPHRFRRPLLDENEITSINTGGAI